MKLKRMGWRSGRLVLGMALMALAAGCEAADIVFASLDLAAAIVDAAS